jgi:hypothetical protein
MKHAAGSDYLGRRFYLPSCLWPIFSWSHALCNFVLFNDADSVSGYRSMALCKHMNYDFDTVWQLATVVNRGWETFKLFLEQISRHFWNHRLFLLPSEDLSHVSLYLSLFYLFTSKSWGWRLRGRTQTDSLCHLCIFTSSDALTFSTFNELKQKFTRTRRQCFKIRGRRISCPWSERKGKTQDAKKYDGLSKSSFHREQG